MADGDFGKAVAQEIKKRPAVDENGKLPETVLPEVVLSVVGLTGNISAAQLNAAGVGGGGGTTPDGAVVASLDDVPDSPTRLAMIPAERSKLGGIAAGATANATNAQLRDRTTHTGTQPAASIYDLTETVQDIVAASLVAGANTTVTYDDAGNTITITATGGGGGVTDPEIVRDVIGAAMVAGSGVQITVNDAGDTLTIASTAVLPTRQIISGTGLTGGGDLSADRTLSVSYGTTAGTAAQGNDSRLSNARTPTAHSHAISDVTGLTNALADAVESTTVSALWQGTQAAYDALTPDPAVLYFIREA